MRRLLVPQTAAVYTLIPIFFKRGAAVTSTAKIFKTGRSQAVRLPMAYRFETSEVFIHRDPETGDVILSSKPSTWDGFLQVRQSASVPADFLNRSERDQGGEHDRDPFEAWSE